MPEIIVKLGDNIVQKYFFVKDDMRIGRASDNEIVIENLAISRNHAVIRWADGHYCLEDLGSSNGTFVNGVRVTTTELMDRDVVAIGKHKLYFYDQLKAKKTPQPTIIEADRTMLVEAPPPEATLEVTRGRQKGQRFTLGATSTTLGRGADCEIRVSDWFVSRQHAVIERRGSLYTIRDLGSWRHTFVNGVTVQEAPLANGDKIQLGPSVQLAFSLEMSDHILEARPSARVPVELGGHPRRDEAAPRAGAPEPNGPAPADAPEDDASIVPLPRPEMDRDEPERDGGAFNLEDVFPSGEAPEPPAQDPELEPAPELAVKTDCEPEAEPEQPLALAPPLLGERDDPEPDPQVEPAPSDPPTDDHAEFKVVISPVGEVMENIAQVSLQAAAAAAVQEIPPAAEEDLTAWNPEEEQSPAPDHAHAADTPLPDGVTLEEIQMWERALQNQSPIIRRQAARRLRQITGRDYEY